MAGSPSRQRRLVRQPALDRSKECLLVTHAGTLFSTFAPDLAAADFRPIDRLVVPLIQAQLETEGLASDTFGPIEEGRVLVTKTADRSVLGSMNDMALMIEANVIADGGLKACDPGKLNMHIRRHISGVRGFTTPIDLARAWRDLSGRQ